MQKWSDQKTNIWLNGIIIDFNKIGIASLIYFNAKRIFSKNIGFKVEFKIFIINLIMS